MTTIEPSDPGSSAKLDTTFLCKICIIVLLGLNLSEGQVLSLLV